MNFLPSSTSPGNSLTCTSRRLAMSIPIWLWLIIGVNAVELSDEGRTVFVKTLAIAVTSILTQAQAPPGPVITHNGLHNATQNHANKTSIFRRLLNNNYNNYLIPDRFTDEGGNSQLSGAPAISAQASRSLVRQVFWRENTGTQDGRLPVTYINNLLSYYRF